MLVIAASSCASPLRNSLQRMSALNPQTQVDSTRLKSTRSTNNSDAGLLGPGTAHSRSARNQGGAGTFISADSCRSCGPAPGLDDDFGCLQQRSNLLDDDRSISAAGFA